MVTRKSPSSLAEKRVMGSDNASRQCHIVTEAAAAASTVLQADIGMHASNDPN